MRRRSGGWVFLLLVAALVAAAPSLVRAQVIDTSQPITIEAPKPVKFLGAVMFSNVQSITVRSRDDLRVIRTFTYSPEIRDEMQQILMDGGYQYDDKVEIESMPGSDIALSIKGKPSKPL